MIGRMTDTLNHPECPAALKPYSRPPKPSGDKTIDVISRLGFVVLVPFLKLKYETLISMTTIGTIIQNSTLQGYISTNQPDKVGPIAGAKLITNLNIPIALPCSDLG